MLAAAVSQLHSNVTLKMTVEIIQMKPVVSMSLALSHSFVVTMDDVSLPPGNATLRMIAVMAQTKAISVPKKHVHTSRYNFLSVWLLE